MSLSATCRWRRGIYSIAARLLSISWFLCSGRTRRQREVHVHQENYGEIGLDVLSLWGYPVATGCLLPVSSSRLLHCCRPKQLLGYVLVVSFNVLAGNKPAQPTLLSSHPKAHQGNLDATVQDLLYIGIQRSMMHPLSPPLVVCADSGSQHPLAAGSHNSDPAAPATGCWQPHCCYCRRGPWRCFYWAGNCLLRLSRGCWSSRLCFVSPRLPPSRHGSPVRPHSPTGYVLRLPPAPKRDRRLGLPSLALAAFGLIYVMTASKAVGGGQGAKLAGEEQQLEDSVTPWFRQGRMERCEMTLAGP